MAATAATVVVAALAVDSAPVESTVFVSVKSAPVTSNAVKSNPFTALKLAALVLSAVDVSFAIGVAQVPSPPRPLGRRGLTGAHSCECERRPGAGRAVSRARAHSVPVMLGWGPLLGSGASACRLVPCHSDPIARNPWRSEGVGQFLITIGTVSYQTLYYDMYSNVYSEYIAKRTTIHYDTY